MLQINAARAQLGDIGAQAHAAHTLTDICFEELDCAGEAITDEAGHRAVLRLDALMKSVFRNVALIQAAVDQAGGALLEVSAAGADRFGWMDALLGAAPDSDRDVLVWHGDDQMPLPAFYAVDDRCWFSKYDGSQLGDGAVTHWSEIQAPEGVAA